MALPRIDLDYRRPRRRLGGAVLGAGIAAAIVTAGAWMDLSEEARVWSRAADAGQAPASDTAAMDPDVAKQLQQAQEVIQRLAVPWDAFFHGMEQAAGERIALLDVEPDPGSRQVRLIGEAQAYGEVLGYLARLEADTPLAQPRLLDHAVRGNGSARPVAFTISAQWKASP